ncbi:MAG TPA: hypothetical protein VLQ67_03255 [Arachnia sp.]|nr:hypothetical protein [Arachnia sp.]
MAHDVLIDPDGGDTIKPASAADQQLGTGGQDRIRGGYSTVFHATPRLAATRAIDIRSTTIDLTATITASRDSFPFDGAAAAML